MPFTKIIEEDPPKWTKPVEKFNEEISKGKCSIRFINYLRIVLQLFYLIIYYYFIPLLGIILSFLISQEPPESDL